MTLRVRCSGVGHKRSAPTAGAAAVVEHKRILFRSMIKSLIRDARYYAASFIRNIRVEDSKTIGFGGSFAYFSS